MFKDLPNKTMKTNWKHCFKDFSVDTSVIQNNHLWQRTILKRIRNPNNSVPSQSSAKLKTKLQTPWESDSQQRLQLSPAKDGSQHQLPLLCPHPQRIDREIQHIKIQHASPKIQQTSNVKRKEEWLILCKLLGLSSVLCSCVVRSGVQFNVWGKEH